MNRILTQVFGALKAAYNFFVGDAIILVAVIVAFGVGATLAHVPGIANPIVAVVMIGIILAGLVTTLGRERAGHMR
jgi:hypothetical protein